MANKDLLKQAIAEAKSVREAAIANAKEALEETLTPHLKDMLAAKLQEMEDKDVEEEVVNEVEEESIEENTSGFEAVEEAEDDTEESEDEAEGEEIEEPADMGGEEEAVEGDEDLGNLTVDQFKDMIRDIIAQELGQGGEEEMGMDMDAGDIEGMGDEIGMEEPALDGEEGEEEIDLDELLRELESISEEKEEEMEEGKKEDDDMMEEDTANQVEAQSETKEKNINKTLKEELDQAMETIETLRKDLQEVNLLNSKLLYVNKIFKANTLTESQKVNIIAAFDKAETVKEVKLVFETVSENVGTTKRDNVTESKVKGMASKATGTTGSKPEIIAENSAVYRMQILAGIKPRQF
jgi:hypothetical protein